MFEIVLVEPEIAPNTGNIMRLCANTGSRLHLIEPLGFWLEDRRLRRAALDYRERATVLVHESGQRRGGRRQSVLTISGSRSYHQISYEAGDALVFGPESRTMPDEVLREFGPEARLLLPMVAGSRSLNLANTVAIVVYEAWRQAGFSGAAR